jgi:Heterokaryon incompatibility protein (HET)
MKLTEAKFIISDDNKFQRNESQNGRAASSVDFTEEAIGPDGLEFGPSQYRLGTLKDLNSRQDNCPFCRLAVGSLEEQVELFLRDTATAETLKQMQDNVNCFVSWQLDGRMIIRDDVGNITGNKACTRRIRLRWVIDDRAKTSNISFSDTYVVLMAGRTADQELFLGRSIDTVKPDAALIKRWIGFCEDIHGDLCKSRTIPPELSKAFFGVIDVKDMCLTKLPKDGKYVALSYTWGRTNYDFETKKENIKGLLAVGGIRPKLSAIPKTIKDAIDLVVNLGERYLWVDRLCIIQDSERSWNLNSRIMDLVYGSAYLTICAADGENAHSGLKILHPSQHGSGQGFKQNIAQYGRNLRLISTMPAETYIKHSAWYEILPHNSYS